MAEAARRRLWVCEFDTWSAESVEHALQLRAKEYGFEPGDGSYGTEDEVKPVDDEKIVRVCYTGRIPDVQSKVPAWARNEPEAKVSSEPGLGAEVVAAPARIWAKHVEGLVCSSELP